MLQIFVLYCIVLLDRWLINLENTKWLQYISGLLKATLIVVNAIDKDRKPVLVHCSDGWDRTPQIVALAELLLDPYYRTVEVRLDSSFHCKDMLFETKNEKCNLELNVVYGLGIGLELWGLVLGLSLVFIKTILHTVRSAIGIIMLSVCLSVCDTVHCG